MRTPTADQATTITVPWNASSQVGPAGGERLSARNRSPSAARARERAHTDHASNTATLRLITPVLYPVPLRLLSQPHTTALTSRKRYGNRYEGGSMGQGNELRRIPLPRTPVNSRRRWRQP